MLPSTVKLPAIRVLPVTVNCVKLPRLVILGCAASVTILAKLAKLLYRAKLALATVFETLAPSIANAVPA